MKRHLWKLTVTLIALATAGLLAASAQAADPANTSPPTITGTPEQGRTLTGHNGMWSGSPTAYHYRWQRCASDGSACGDIDNAVGRTYLLKANDVDQTIRLVVTASNADGQTVAASAVTDVISSNTAPKNTAKPTVTGNVQVGEELTATKGTWTGGARSFTYQWQRCDSAGANCADAAGANGSSYGVRAADVGKTVSVVVTATNLAGSATSTSDATAVVHDVPTPPSPPTTTPEVNHRPTLAILGLRFIGARVYARLRVCDDSGRNVAIPERDAKRGTVHVRTFRTLVPPRNCAALTRSWAPSPRFRHGRYVVTFWARDYAGLTSRPTSRAFFR